MAKIIISEAINKLIKKYGSQEELARAIGVSVFTVSKWKNGHTEPSPMAVNKIKQLMKKGG